MKIKKKKKSRSLPRQMGNTQINSKSPGRWHYIARLALCLQNPSTYHTNDKSASVLRLLLGIWTEPAQPQAVIMAIAVRLDEVWRVSSPGAPVLRRSRQLLHISRWATGTLGRRAFKPCRKQNKRDGRDPPKQCIVSTTHLTPDAVVLV